MKTWTRWPLMSRFDETYHFSDQLLIYQKTDFLFYPMTNVFFAVGGVRSGAWMNWRKDKLPHQTT